VRADDLGPELTDDIRLLSAWYKCSPNDYCRIVLQRSIDQLKDTCPNITEILQFRR
jgi:hypothetical protein